MPDRIVKHRRHGPWRALLAALLVCASGTAIAGNDHDRARQALEAGEVLPLRTILERVEREQSGQVIDVELERDHRDGSERWIYEVKLLRSGGALVKLKINARDGSVISQKARHGDKP
jgi:uncharacterized membrane protein YkoI